MSSKLFKLIAASKMISRTQTFTRNNFLIQMKGTYYGPQNMDSLNKFLHFSACYHAITFRLLEGATRSVL